MTHPAAREIRREGREIAARLHIEHDEADHAYDTRHHARCGCTHCKRYNAMQEDAAGPGLYDFERPATGPRVEESRDRLAQNLAWKIEDVARKAGTVCACEPVFAEYGGKDGPLPSAFAKARAGKKVRRTEESHRSRRGDRNGARCYVYRPAEAADGPALPAPEVPPG